MRPSPSAGLAVLLAGSVFLFSPHLLAWGKNEPPKVARDPKASGPAASKPAPVVRKPPKVVVEQPRKIDSAARVAVEKPKVIVEKPKLTDHVAPTGRATAAIVRTPPKVAATTGASGNGSSGKPGKESGRGSSNKSEKDAPAGSGKGDTAGTGKNPSSGKGQSASSGKAGSTARTTPKDDDEQGARDNYKAIVDSAASLELLGSSKSTEEIIEDVKAARQKAAESGLAATAGSRGLENVQAKDALGIPPDVHVADMIGASDLVAKLSHFELEGLAGKKETWDLFKRNGADAVINDQLMKEGLVPAGVITPTIRLRPGEKQGLGPTELLNIRGQIEAEGGDPKDRSQWKGRDPDGTRKPGSGGKSTDTPREQDKGNGSHDPGETIPEPYESSAGNHQNDDQDHDMSDPGESPTDTDGPAQDEPDHDMHDPGESPTDVDAPASSGSGDPNKKGNGAEGNGNGGTGNEKAKPEPRHVTVSGGEEGSMVQLDSYDNGDGTETTYRYEEGAYGQGMTKGTEQKPDGSDDDDGTSSSSGTSGSSNSSSTSSGSSSSSRRDPETGATRRRPAQNRETLEAALQAGKALQGSGGRFGNGKTNPNPNESGAETGGGQPKTNDLVKQFLGPGTRGGHVSGGTPSSWGKSNGAGVVDPTPDGVDRPQGPSGPGKPDVSGRAPRN